MRSVIETQGNGGSEHSSVLASIYTYAAEASVPRDSMADALVQSNNFVIKTEQARLKCSLHAYHILILEDDPPISASKPDDEASIPQSKVAESIESVSTVDNRGMVSNSSRSLHTSIKVPLIIKASNNLEKDAIQPVTNSGSVLREVMMIDSSTSSDEEPHDEDSDVQQKPSIEDSRVSSNGATNVAMICFCGKSFSNSDSLRRHQKNSMCIIAPAHVEWLIKYLWLETCTTCSACQKPFKTPAELLTHKENGHGTAELCRNGRMRSLTLSSKSCLIYERYLEL